MPAPVNTTTRPAEPSSSASRTAPGVAGTLKRP
jgi:hypothetical protein